MSAVDPLAAAMAANADLAALIDGELAQLAADAQALRALLVEDAVVTARVLPSNGLTDLLEIAGRRVAASLPPTVRPGDVLQVRVSGFDGERILLQVVGTGADAAVETGPQSAPLAPNAGVFVAASITQATAPTAPAPAPPGALATGAPTVPAAPSPPGTPSTPVPPNASGAPNAAAAPNAPAASGGDVPAVQLDLPPAAAPPARPGSGGSFTSVASRANVIAAHAPEGAAGAASGVPLRAPAAGEPTSIEVRLAAARAAAPVLPGSSAEAYVTPGAGAQRFVARPPIEAKAAAPNDGVLVHRVPPGAPRSSALAAYAEPVALLRALRLPVTPSNVSSAALALAQPERLPDALAALERALPRAGDDPNVATLRTLLAFVGRIDPRSPVLAAQIAAFVDHVADGAEPKLATLLAASQAAAAPGDSSPPLPAAVAAERSAALATDLKQTLLAVAANPATPESVAPSLAGALTALTAVQVHAAQALAAHPDGFAFTIPLATQHGTSNAHITVQRDAPESRPGVRLDPDNFRIAFVLETAHYGTVAIDLVTVGRDVTVDVRTEAAPAMRAFRDALGTLTARLESLRYRVASAGAAVGTTSTIAVEAPPAPALDPDAVVDRSV